MSAYPSLPTRKWPSSLAAWMTIDELLYVVNVSVYRTCLYFYYVFLCVLVYGCVSVRGFAFTVGLCLPHASLVCTRAPNATADLDVF